MLPRFIPNQELLDPSGDVVAGSQGGIFLDDLSYYGLVETLASLSSVDFAAVLRGVRYRRRGVRGIGAASSVQSPRSPTR